MTNILLKNANFSVSLDDGDIYAAAYSGKLFVGRTVLNAEAEPMFDNTRTVKINQNCFVPLMVAIKKARRCYEHNPENEEFEFEIQRKKGPLSKRLYGAFSQWGDDPLPRFHLRVKWDHVRDKAHQLRVRKGLATPLPDSEPKFTRVGVTMNQDLLEKFITYQAKLLLSTYMMHNEELVEKIHDFIYNGKEIIDEELLKKLQEADRLTLSERNKIVDDLLEAYSKEFSEESEDFKLKKFRDQLVERDFAVFGLYIMLA